MLARRIRLVVRIAVPIACALPIGAQSTTRASVSTGSGEANAESGPASLSDDGHVVAFTSTATNLVANDTNGVRDIFMRNRVTGFTSRVSVGPAGSEGNGPSFANAVSGNGLVVAFDSEATNLVGNDTNAKRDVFAFDTQLAVTICASVTPLGVPGNNESRTPTISADGRWIAFAGEASNLVAGDTNGGTDVFVRDLQTATTTRVSVRSGGLQAQPGSDEAAISADGRYVVFSSTATDLVANDTNARSDIFIHDRQAITTTRVSVNSSGLQAAGESYEPRLSENGQFVVFYSDAGNLVSQPWNGFWQVFVHDQLTGATALVGVNSSGMPGAYGATTPFVSGDGRYVMFSSSDNLAPGSGSGVQVYVRELATHTTARVSVNSNNTPANAASWGTAIARDGNSVALSSAATNLVASDTNGAVDVFVREGLVPEYVDADGDGYGAGPVACYGAQCGAGFVLDNTDCDDTHASVHPGAPEICDGLDNDCNGAIDEGFVANYCTAATTVQGCVPSIGFVGAPSSVALNGFSIHVAGVPGQRYGTVFFGFSPTAQNWAVGSTSYLCMFFPVQRTGVLDSGGTIGACDGVLSIDWNAWRSANPGALGSPYGAGQVLYVQGWFRDPGAAKQTNLSDGLRFTLCN